MSDVANAIAIAISILIVGVELAWCLVRARRRRGPLGYAFHDSVTNVSLAVGSLLFGAVTALQGFAVHRYLDEHCALFRLPSDSVWVWVAVMVLVDLCFYASHRAMHRVNLLWTAHAVHHQSEEYNLLVAMRIGWISVYFSWIFYLPLALLGVSLSMTLIARAISSAYQFVLHTRVIGKLGLLELVMVTPSHHRVHHAVNPRYLDKNYGGMLILWDRIFGTFAAESEEPVYGSGSPLRSFNPIWANVVEWVRLLKMSRATARFRDKVQLWLRQPAWQPRDFGGAAVASELKAADRIKYDVPVPRRVERYVAGNLALTVCATLLIMSVGSRLSTFGFVVLSLEIVAATVVSGALIEGRRWAWPLERARLASLAAVVLWVVW